LQARVRRLRPWQLLAASAMLCAAVSPLSVRAQDAAVPVQTTSQPQVEPVAPPPTDPPAAVPGSPDEPIAFEADEVEYNQNNATVTASGAVVLRRNDQSVRADQVTCCSPCARAAASPPLRENGCRTAMSS
jgi:LPS-assembly protein